MRAVWARPQVTTAVWSGGPDKLTADLATTPNRAIYWIDLVLTASLAWGGLWIVATAHRPGVAVAAGLVGLLALYRGLSFIHEISHLRPKDVPGFRLGWNLVIGVPLMTPSMMYEGVHNLHHAKHRFGTDKRSGIPAAGPLFTVQAGPVHGDLAAARRWA